MLKRLKGMAIANIDLSLEIIKDFCQRWQIDQFALFGSVLRDDFRKDSDIDVLVAFNPDAHTTLFDMVNMKAELEQIFDREVDLVSRKGIENSRNYLRREEILDSAVQIYDANQMKDR